MRTVADLTGENGLHKLFQFFLLRLVAGLDGGAAFGGSDAAGAAAYGGGEFADGGAVFVVNSDGGGYIW